MKAKDFIAALQTMKGWGYVLGGKGQLYTKSLAERWGAAKQGGNSLIYFTVTAKKWFGVHVVDCSGLITVALGLPEKNADTLYSECTAKGVASTIPEIPGICVWRKGHIGVYLGNGMVIESGGVAKGVVQSKLLSPATGKAWSYWGKLSAVDYSAGVSAAKPTFHVTKTLKKGMDDPEVISIARNLTALGITQRGETSIFDAALELDVKSFQRKYGLSVTGVVDKAFVEKLGGKWDGK